jgi:alpha-amylase
MASICFYFQVHQPFRLRKYTIFDVDKEHNYFDEKKNKEVCRKVAQKCYLPANHLMLELINKFQGRFRITYSISGMALEQFEKYAPEVIESFQRLARTGCVEFLTETYYHSLSFLYSKEEFLAQVQKHTKRIKELFNYEPKILRNTELIYNNELALFAEKNGYQGILAEGVDHILGWRSPNFVYKPKGAEKIKLLLKNYKLSDDIAFRFSNKGWKEWPLSADKYVSWLNQVNGAGYIINLFMDYETFGEHQWEDTGIFEFMKHLPGEFLKNRDNDFKTLSEAVAAYPVSDEIDVPYTISWADLERDLSAWLGNRMQHNAVNDLYALESAIKQSGDTQLLEDWRKLTISDHIYYMCTKWFSDGDVHRYFNPYNTPYDAFITYMNILEDIRKRLAKIERPGISLLRTAKAGQPQAEPLRPVLI